jgi:S1-C subfamily serine protease
MDITEGLRPAIVAILAGEDVIGTGFFVTSDGYVLTCYHVIEPLLDGGNNQITIKTRTGDKIKATYEKNKSGPEGHIDFAVLNTLDKGPFHCLPLSRDCNVGDRWCSRGFSFPRTYEDARNEGTVFDKPERPQGGYDIKLSSDSPVRGGSSGSPLLDYRTGSVFGIMKSRPTEEGWSEGFAVPIEDVLARWPQLERLNSESETLILVRPPPRGIINVPDLPPSFLARPDVLMAVKEVLLADSGQATAITGTRSRVGLHGMGGIGKSVLAAAIARDADVQARFHDGILAQRRHGPHDNEPPGQLGRDA